MGEMGEWIQYVPELNGNRDMKDPITVEILPMTVRDARRMSRGIVAKRVKGGGFRTNQAEISEQLFLSHVRNIKNLTDEKWKAITTADELLDSHFIGLTDEIEEAINDISILDEGDVKNFKLRSDGYLERIHGTAKSAPNSSREPVTAEGITEE